MHVDDLWEFSGESGLSGDPTAGIDVSGFGVEAIDGSIGKVDKATYEVGSSQIVVDTGPWIFGKKVVLPAGVIDRLDREDEKIYVRRTKDQIKDSPKFGETELDETDRSALGSYYGPGGAGYQDRQSVDI